MSVIRPKITRRADGVKATAVKLGVLVDIVLDSPDAELTIPATRRNFRVQKSGNRYPKDFIKPFTYIVLGGRVGITANRRRYEG